MERGAAEDPQLGWIASRWWALLLTVLLLVSVLLPVSEKFRGDYGDSFPFSWYPMFAAPRPEVEYAYYVLGLGKDRRRVFVPSHFYVRGGMNQARRQLGALVKGGKSQDTCETAALALSEVTDPKYADLTELRVVLGGYTMRGYFAEGNSVPVAERVFARCRIERPSERSGGTQ